MSFCLDFRRRAAWPVVVGLLAVANWTPIARGQAGQWVTWSNQTTLRLPTGSGLNDPALSTNDTQEKDYAWGDIDQDGDPDLVVVRKSPFTTIGRRPNVLFMNEGLAQGHAMNGVLVERTFEYIPGFLDDTDDRDVVLVDVNLDGWLDIVTAVTYGQGLPKDISHPRVYINLGDDGSGWQGFEYQSARIPQLPSHPNFCGVAAGDVTGDGVPDLYFTDYDNEQPNGFDDRLLINDGNGFFSDQSTTRLSSAMLDSGFGIHAVIADMNRDGWNDIVKNENGPVETFNNAGSGFFDILDNTYGGAAYFFNIGYIDEPAPHIGASYDIVISDDGTDRWLKNIGNGSNGMADFTQFTLPPSTGGFGSNSLVVDLNQDGWNDLIIADVDVDAQGCSRVTDILRNEGNPPNNTFTPDTGSIPENMLSGVHDVAVMDVNGDSWMDLVLGRCSGTQVWINAPPVGLTFSYPDGLPSEVIPPGQSSEFMVQLHPLGDTVDPDNVQIFVSVNNDPYTSTPLVHEGGDSFLAVLPPGECLDNLRFYIAAGLDSGPVFRDPPDAPINSYGVVIASGTEVAFQDNIEGDVSTWLVLNDPALASGVWEQADPNGTISSGQLVAPEDDATPDGIKAFVTGAGQPGQNANVHDVDGGPTHLISPVIDLAGTDAYISYDRWFMSLTGTHDTLVTEISNDGGDTWVQVSVSLETNSAWENERFLVSDFVSPTSAVRVRFSTCDCPNDSLTEAGIDNFLVEMLSCEATGCVEDLDGNGEVDAADLAVVLGDWGPNPGSPADFNIDDVVDAADLAIVLGGWGPCP